MLRRLRGSAIVGSVAALVVVLASPFTAAGASPDVVISEVYGGGGNSGAPFANDFVELFNRSGGTVSVAGWSVQYASASGTTWSVTALSGSIQPGHYYLIRLAAGSGGGAGPPAPAPARTTKQSAPAGQ